MASFWMLRETRNALCRMHVFTRRFAQTGASTLSIAPHGPHRDSFEKFGVQHITNSHGQSNGAALLEAVRLHATASPGKPLQLVVGGQKITRSQAEEMESLASVTWFRRGTDARNIETTQPIRNTPYVNAPFVAQDICKEIFHDPKAGETLALVGFGPINQEVARKAIALGLNVVVYTPRLADETTRAEAMQGTELEHKIRFASTICEACNGAHYLSIACNENPSSHHQITPQALDGLKPQARMTCVSPFAVLAPETIPWLAAQTYSKRLAHVVLDNNPEQVALVKQQCGELPSTMHVRSSAMAAPECVQALNNAVAITLGQKYLEDIIVGRHRWPQSPSSKQHTLLIGGGFNNLVHALMSHPQEDITIIDPGGKNTSNTFDMRHISPAETLPHMTKSREHALTTPLVLFGWAAYGDRQLTDDERAFIRAWQWNAQNPALVALSTSLVRACNTASIIEWSTLIAQHPNLFRSSVVENSSLVRCYTSEKEIESAQKSHATFGAYVTRLDMSDPRLHGLNPEIIAGALNVTLGMAFKAQVLERDLKRHLQERGVRFIKDKATRWEQSIETGRVHVSLQSGETISGDRALISTGAQSSFANAVQGVAGFFAQAHGMPNRTFKLHPPSKTNLPVMNFIATHEGTPSVSFGAAYVGQGKIDHNLIPTYVHMAEYFLSSVAGQKVTLSDITLCSENGGRPFTADGMPIVHRDGNVVSILGTNAAGLTLAPLMSRMAMSYWAGKINPLHLALSPQLRVLSKEP